jgi:hypothetical protein
LEVTAEGDSVEEEDEKRLALIELDDAAIESTLTKVQQAVDEKTGKHFTFRTEEMLLQHVQTILEAAVPLRNVLLGALNEVTIEEAILAFQSRYECVRDEISGHSQIHEVHGGSMPWLYQVNWEQWAECIDRFERTYGPINTEMIRTLGKLTVIDNPRTSFIKDDKNYLIGVREYDDGFSDFKSARDQVETVWRKLETRE